MLSTFGEQPRSEIDSADIDHRLTKQKHPWTNSQVERMNRTLKEATGRRYHYDSHGQLREHLAIFLAAYNFAKRLKAGEAVHSTLNRLTEMQNPPGERSPLARPHPMIEPREHALDVGR